MAAPRGLRGLKEEQVCAERHLGLAGLPMVLSSPTDRERLPWRAGNLDVVCPPGPEEPEWGWDLKGPYGSGQVTGGKTCKGLTGVL